MITPNEARIVTNKNLDKAIARAIIEEERKEEKLKEQNIINTARKYLADILSKTIGEKIASHAADGYNTINISCGDRGYVSIPWKSDLFINSREFVSIYEKYMKHLNNGESIIDRDCWLVYDYTLFIQKIITKILVNNDYNFTEYRIEGNNKYSNRADFTITW